MLLSFLRSCMQDTGQKLPDGAACGQQFQLSVSLRACAKLHRSKQVICVSLVSLVFPRGHGEISDPTEVLWEIS